MSETIFVINPSFVCPFCGERFGDDEERELVMIESGQLTQMKRDPDWLVFLADHDNEGDQKLQREAVLEYYHADCFIDRMRGCEWGNNSPHACDLCNVSFRRIRWAFRGQLGRYDVNTSCFVPLNNVQNEAILCPSCLAEGIGEGDMEEGELLLGIAR